MMVSLMDQEIPSKVIYSLFFLIFGNCTLTTDFPSHIIICNVSNSYCCSTWIISFLDILYITYKMVTILHGTSSTARYIRNDNILANATLGSKLPSLKRGLLSWIPQVWRVTDDQVLEAAGLDAYVVCPIIPVGTDLSVSWVLQNGNNVPIS
jgi:hypothetical protein